MADQTSIEWAANADGTPGATWNPIRARDILTGKVGTFCVHKSPGCENCYAERLQGRGLPNNGIGLAYTAQNLERVELFIDDKMIAAPARRKKPTTFFLSSMTDVFGEFITDAMLDRLFVEMAQCRRHTFIVLTKRADRMHHYMTELPQRIRDWDCHAGLDFVDLPLPNVWLVVSCEDQRRANERIPDLLATPAVVRGVSCEPLLGPIDLQHIEHKDGARISALSNGQRRHFERPKLDWVICGGESGPGARPMHPDWARSLRDQCAAAGVPFFFKQWGEWKPHDQLTPEEATAGGLTASVASAPPDRFDAAFVTHMGKKKAGRELDGRTHDERPPLGGRNG